MQRSKEPVAQANEWSRFHSDRIKGNYPRWPNEAMLKALFGSYSSRPLKPQPGWKVLDIGCGFGNNLVPFADLGCECHGIEIHDEISALAGEALAARGYKAEIRTGSNRALPYEDRSFDLVLSVNTIHTREKKPSSSRRCANSGVCCVQAAFSSCPPPARHTTSTSGQNRWRGTSIASGTTISATARSSFSSTAKKT